MHLWNTYHLWKINVIEESSAFEVTTARNMSTGDSEIYVERLEFDTRRLFCSHRSKMVLPNE